MSTNVSANMSFRERAGPIRAITCPRCGEMNPLATSRCRSCLTPLPSKATSAPRIAHPIIEMPRSQLDAIFGELEALTRDEDVPSVHFQCPQCGRLVDEVATQCHCGAIFADAHSPVGYECPLCGSRVSGDATACRCGARFSE